MIVSTMSMKAGHSSTHAMHVVRPELLRLDERAVDRPRRLPVEVALELDDDLLGRERRPRHEGGTRRLAAAALHAGREVEPALPRELFEPADAERLRLLDVVDLADLAARRELGEEDVERRRHEVDEVG